MQSITAAIDSAAPVTQRGARDGAALYQTFCAGCHGDDRKGIVDTGNALNNTAFIAERSDEELLTVIRVGRPKNAPGNLTGFTMPPSGGSPDLTDAEILKIIQYLREE